MIPFRKHLILSSSISNNFRSIIHGAWRNSRCFTASFTMRIHFTVWADCAKESESAGFTILITLISLFVSLDQRNQSSSRTILWTESFITAIFWLLNINLTGRTQGNIFLPIEWRLVPIYCYSLSFYAQTTCLENRDRKKCLGQIFWNEKRELMRSIHIRLEKEKFREEWFRRARKAKSVSRLHF